MGRGGYNTIFFQDGLECVFHTIIMALLSPSRPLLCGNQATLMRGIRVRMRGGGGSVRPPRGAPLVALTSPDPTDPRRAHPPAAMRQFMTRAQCCVMALFTVNM